MTRRPTRCPAPDCGFSDVPSLVAAHVNGTEGPEHDWARLPYDGPGDFLSAMRDGDGGERGDDTAGGTSDGTADGTGDDTGDGTGDDTGDGEEPRSHAIDPEPVFRAVEVARDRSAGVEDLEDLETPALADLFVAFSVLASEAGTVRSDVRTAIIDRIDEEMEIEGELGSIGRSMSTRRSLRSEETVRRALFEAGIDPRTAESFDPDLVRDLVDKGDIDEDTVFETSRSDHVRRTTVDEEAFEER